MYLNCIDAVKNLFFLLAHLSRHSKKDSKLRREIRCKFPSDLLYKVQSKNTLQCVFNYGVNTENNSDKKPKLKFAFFKLWEYWQSVNTF